MTETAAARWRDALQSWAIPEPILSAAPESPWGHPTALFARAAHDALHDETVSPSRARALEALPDGGTVVDVGVGGGAASLPLAPPAGHIVGVDESQSMLDSFAAAAAARGVTTTTVLGRWPDIAASVDVGDVVVCHHVAYNTPDLDAVFRALTEHARHRVVVELTEQHPQSDLNELWLTIHGLVRPTAPTAADAAAVAAELGYDVHREETARAGLWTGLPIDERVAFARKRLCVGPEHDATIAGFFESRAPQQRVTVTLWWNP